MCGLHPAVAHAIEQFSAARDVRAVVKHSGYSHRHFIALFRWDVGLAPKTFCRVLRFQHALQAVPAKGVATWADLAMDYGYSDHAHFHREFQEFVGMTPEAYRKIAPEFAHHVAIGLEKLPPG